MNQDFRKILVIQTAFIGDVILTLPLIQVLKRNFADSEIDVVATPQASGLFENHPAIHHVVPYDKRGSDRGVAGFRRLTKQIAKERYDLALVPHRSVRSALLAFGSHIPVRVGFDRSDGKWLFSHIVPYRKDIHEIERNLSLMNPIRQHATERELPSLYPGELDRRAVQLLLRQLGEDQTRPLAAIAPGTIWNTKRWPKERFADVARRLSREGTSVVLIGSEADSTLCNEICGLAKENHIHNTAGKLTILQSAELIRQSRIIISNDSAPMHLGVAVRTPVVAIFGATVPAFGFSPYGQRDVVVETLGLSCRPCSIHGSHSCPIKTFDCMMDIDAERVLRIVDNMLQ